MRMDRKEYFLEIAKLVAERSTCLRAKVGAVLVHKNRIVSTGYNGSPPGAKHCIDDGVGCLEVAGHCIRTIHAELNAILHLEHNYDELELYCTHSPCINCLKAMITINVKHIYYRISYPDSSVDKLLFDLGPSRIMITHILN